MPERDRGGFAMFELAEGGEIPPGESVYLEYYRSISNDCIYEKPRAVFLCDTIVNCYSALIFCGLCPLA